MTKPTHAACVVDTLLPSAVEGYLQRLNQESDPVVRRMQEHGEAMGFPIIGPLVGRLCAQWARAVGASRVFEMGSGFGYSTAFFARAVGPQGRVVHTDGSAANSQDAKDWLGQAGLASRVDFKLGDARDLLRAEPGTFDVVFIDIDKHQYPAAWQVACEKVRPGGVILTDNTLWSGRAADAKAVDRDSAGVKAYNDLAFHDPRYLSTLVPLRDGVTVSLRIK